MEGYTVDTYNLMQYSYEVDQFPHLSAEETARLGQLILLAHQGQLSQAAGMAARDAIVHGHLHLVLSLTQRYPLAYRDDLVQEGNIALLEAVEQYSFRDGCDFASYACVAIQHAIADAMEFVLPIRIPRSSMRVAQANGTADRLYAMQPINLDKPYDSELDLADTLPAPETAADSQKHTHASSPTVEALLEMLPGLVQEIIELRYGFDEHDQREHTYVQIAHKLGISSSLAYKLEQQGLAALAGKHIQPDQLRKMVQESRLNAAYARLRQEPFRISGRLLAQAANVRRDAADAYLARMKQSERQEDKAKTSTLGKKTYTKLLHVYLQLQEQSGTVSVQALQKASGATWRTAKKFLELRAEFFPRPPEQASACLQVMEV